MPELIRDLRRAILRLAKSPGFTLTSLLTLALGIGSTTAVYTIVKGILLEPLPYPEPERLVLIQEKNPDAGFPRFSLSPPNFRDYRDMSHSFEAMAASSGTTLALAASDGGMARRLSGRAVTSDFLRVFGVEPVEGRDFTPEDDRPGAPRVVLLSYDVWQSLGASKDIVDSELVIDGEPMTVIGILPPDFRAGSEALVPLAVDYDSSGRGGHYLIAFGRLKEGVTLDKARSELETVAARLEESYPDSNTGWGAVVDPLKDRMVEDVDTVLWVLLAAVGLVLLIACTNVANLTLARATSRSQETALKSALGARRRRLLGEQLLESLTLALLAGGLGLWLGHYGTRWMLALGADRLPRSQSVQLDGGVVWVALFVSLGTVVLIGLLPALRSPRGNLAGALQDVGRGQAGSGKSTRLRSLLVGGEVALALVLLVASGLLIRTLNELLDIDPGFEPESLWISSFSFPEASYEEAEQRTAFLTRLLDEARAMPGVVEAASVMPMPLSGGGYVLAFYLEGEPIPPPNQEPNANIRFVTPGYFRAMGIPLASGRDLRSTDNDDAQRVLLVNQSAAERFWPGEDPLGKRITFGRPDDEDVEWFTVIGTVGDVHHDSLDSDMEPAFYRATYQGSPGFATLVLRTDGDPATLATPLRQLVGRLDPNLALFREQRGTDLVANSVSQPRSTASLLTTFAATALLLAAIGVFGVVSYLVTLQQRELGVRLALGAHRGQILALVLGQGLRPVALGLAVGLLAAAGAARFLQSLLYGVRVSDPRTYLVVALLLATTAAAASLIPAFRATRVDPMAVLRDE